MARNSWSMRTRPGAQKRLRSRSQPFFTRQRNLGHGLCARPVGVGDQDLRVDDRRYVQPFLTGRRAAAQLPLADVVEMLERVGLLYGLPKAIASTRAPNSSRVKSTFERT